MSITSVLLLSLLCIGAAKTHELENKNSDFSNFYANAFTDILRNAIVYKQKSYLKQMIADNFLFSACTKNYNRQEIIDMMTQLPNANVTFKPYSAHYSSDERYIEFTMTISGIGVAIDGNFFIEFINGRWVFIEGRVPWCPRPRRFNAIPASDGSEDFTKAFIDSLSGLIAAKDQSKLTLFFSDKFLFHGCKGDYNKRKILALFDRLPANFKFSITFRGSQWVSNNADIQFSVLIRGFELDPFQAQFILHRENGNYALIGGKVSKCVSRFQ